MEKYQCLICGDEMVSHHKIAFVDYICNGYEDHHFSWRVKENALLKLRIQFRDGKQKICLKIHYDEKYSEVWTDSKSTNRIRIDQIVVPDFTNLEMLKNKIKTLLVFG